MDERAAEQMFTCAGALKAAAVTVATYDAASADVLRGLGDHLLAAATTGHVPLYLQALLKRPPTSAPAQTGEPQSPRPIERAAHVSSQQALERLLSTAP